MTSNTVWNVPASNAARLTFKNVYVGLSRQINATVGVCYAIAVPTKNTLNQWFRDSVHVRSPFALITAAPQPQFHTNALWGTLGAPFNQRINATGSLLVWSIVGGTLPPGLRLEANGMISGTPTQIGIFQLTAIATNVHGNATRVITIEITEQQPHQIIDPLYIEIPYNPYKLHPQIDNDM